MRLFNKVAIVGTGLIGGSIALAIKRRKLATEVMGVSKHKKSLWLAKARGAIDLGSQKFDIIKDADFLIFATPVKTILKLAPKIYRIISKECLVTDVGSTKEEIVKQLERFFPNYVGSHPLAGSEKRSVVNAHPDIFNGSLCILTPTKNTNNLALKKLSQFWEKIGAKTVPLSPKTHDKILSFTSHLPHVVAFSLIRVIPTRYLRFAASGLKDSTRIAGSDSSLWIDILLSNQRNISKSLELFQRNLSEIKLAINKKDKKLLAKILKEAKKKGDNLD